MVSTLIIGIIFFGIVGMSAYKFVQSMKNNSCPGCACACSKQQRKVCNQKGITP